MNNDLKRLELESTHVELGGKMVDFAGFYMPIQYSGVVNEHKQVRESVGIFDVSHMGEFFVESEGALNLIQKVTSNDASKLKIGDAQYSCLPNDTGGIVDDLLVYRLAENRYMLVVNASNIQKDWDWINSHNEYNAQLSNESDDYCLFAVQGPKAIDVLQRLTSVNLGEIKYYTFKVDEIGGISDVIISATGYTGSGGFELYVPKESGKLLWDKILKEGASEGIIPIGLGARDTLRLEKGFCLYGNDIDDTTSPIEAGLNWITKFSKEFINSENLKAQKEAGITKRLVGFEMIERGIPRSGYDILNTEREKIGRVTSGGQSPILNKGIGMGYVQKPHTKSGSEIYIQIRKKQIKAEIVKLPFV